MLTNSPMADPVYQREHKIEVDDDSRVVATATMSTEDIGIASTICRVFQGIHRFGILRYVVRWLQWEKALDPLEVIHDLVRDVPAQLEYPLLGVLIGDASTVSKSISDLVDTVVSFREQLRKGALWEALSTQFISWASRRYDFCEDDTLRHLGWVQARLMPSAGRTFPDRVAMTHDVANWYDDWRNGRGAPLGTYGPTVLDVADPFGLSSQSYFETVSRVPAYSWELESALSQIRRDSAKTLAALDVSHSEDLPMRFATQDDREVAQ
jgi:hypothetical protein